MSKTGRPDSKISELISTFNDLYEKGVVNNFKSLQDNVQKIKDAYFNLMQEAAKYMAANYTQIQKDAKKLIKKINALPTGLNDEAINKVNNILQYATQRTSSNVDIEYDVKDKQTRFTYSEMLSYIQLFNSKKTELEIIESGLIKTAPSKPEKGAKEKSAKNIYKSTIPGKILKVSEYKSWLLNELQKISGASADDEIEIDNKD